VPGNGHICAPATAEGVRSKRCYATLSLALFGHSGYSARLGWLNAPARILQAAAPLVFGAALAACGLNTIWLTAGIGMLATAALLILRG